MRYPTGGSPGVTQPPYSPPAAIPGGGLRNNYGRVFGTQTVEHWDPGVSDRRPILDMVRSESLWRVSVTGDVVIYARWGTSGTHELTLHTPIDCTFPGFASLDVAPRDEAHEGTVQALVSATPVWGAGHEVMRSLVDAVGSAVALPPEAQKLRVIHAAGANVFIRGILVTVPFLQEVELLYPSSLQTGIAIVEYLA